MDVAQEKEFPIYLFENIEPIIELAKFSGLVISENDISEIKRQINEYSEIPASAGGSFKRIRRRLKDTQKRKLSNRKHRRTLKIKTI